MNRASTSYAPTMPFLAKSTRRPWVPAPAPPKPYVQHKARTADYDSPEWKALRKAQLQRQPMCVVCGASGKWMVADHVTPVRLGGGFYDINNLQTLCKKCHQRKSQSERLLKA
jgi:5-methylcytosine-specific restriction enzyme A